MRRVPLVDKDLIRQHLPLGASKTSTFGTIFLRILQARGLILLFEEDKREDLDSRRAKFLDNLQKIANHYRETNPLFKKIISQRDLDRCLEKTSRDAVIKLQGNLQKRSSESTAVIRILAGMAEKDPAVLESLRKMSEKIPQIRYSLAEIQAQSGAQKASIERKPFQKEKRLREGDQEPDKDDGSRALKQSQNPGQLTGEAREPVKNGLDLLSEYPD